MVNGEKTVRNKIIKAGWSQTMMGLQGHVTLLWGKMTECPTLVTDDVLSSAEAPGLSDGGLGKGWPE